ncbi:PAS domain-containing protein [Candidatus Saccharibacteria bacterium]|nr:PAS domain-containing protein [Candidatus Saccharibacteria bacterium]
MGIFSRDKKTPEAPANGHLQTELMEMIFANLTDGLIVIDGNNMIKSVNPVALMLCGVSDANMVLGLDPRTMMHFENGEGMQLTDDNNPILAAIWNATALQTKDYVLITAQNHRRPVAINVIPLGDAASAKVVMLRDITKELEEEGEKTEFISTASHEMRTPVASIEGYLGLALNPQTATIDERARKYLEEAHQSSQHLGRLFQDLLDVTKLDDNKVKVRLQPVEVISLVKSIADGHSPMIAQKNLHYTFGSANGAEAPERRLEQVVYASVDVDFLREILNNLIENAIKYTPEGGAIWVNARGDGDRVLINVTDSGMGISPDNLKHIFQKFYRVDNSQTREIGGTGLGLYIVKQRAEAMGGNVWAESSFGEGSTFYLSLPRLTAEEYERRKQIIANQEAMGAAAVTQAQAPVQPQPVAQPAPVVSQPAPVAQPAQQIGQPQIPPNPQN